MTGSVSPTTGPAAAEVITPDLRGFGESDKHQADPASQYSTAAQARSVAALIEELGLARPVIGGYDIRSRIAQALAADRADLVRALVISLPLPGIGDRILSPEAQRESWYQQFHRLDLPAQLIDGNPATPNERLATPPGTHPPTPPPTHPPSQSGTSLTSASRPADITFRTCLITGHNQENFREGPVRNRRKCSLPDHAGRRPHVSCLRRRVDGRVTGAERSSTRTRNLEAS